MSFFGRFRTPVYQNTGSTARDHLASERTYLSWLRTGLGFIALGIAIERFNQLDLTSLLSNPAAESITPAHRNTAQDEKQKEKEHLLVGALLGTGGGSICYGTTRYFSNMRMLEKGLFKPAYFGAAALSICVAGLAGAVYVEALREKRKRK
ncbi:uncharacterized protein BDR25DRAFT_301489 [Lindgomyces ingoldianus]|uniref:Uncharacterized protein n=1 Tax=Lindgomyces ingoldianus TaxID=673940 RepID=A0ACB6R6G3_9PLEO|nr:uncharacterized protein BDR25DRAFT_301489 [Lindgomyces ingoldianus]KAF2474889.1 hypothetical protein BDR25DRAFT_301489 [Lindgomyces ingoldianus]